MTERRAKVSGSAKRAASRRQPGTPPQGLDRHAWGEWLHGYEWSHVVTLTTAEAFSAPALERAFGEYAATIAKYAAPRVVSWFRGIEGTRAASDRPHIHALFGGTEAVAIRRLREGWRHGHVDAKKYDPSRGGAWYCTKEFTSDCDSYDVSPTLPPERLVTASGLCEGEPPAPALAVIAGRPSRLDEMVSKWDTRRREGEALNASAPLGAVCAEILADLASLRAAEDAATVSLIEAAARSGYSVDHLGRLLASGRIENVGRKGKPRIRVADIPLKPGRALRAVAGDSQFSARRQIVRSVTTGRSA